MSSDTFTQHLKNNIKLHEGSIPHLYLDTRGNATIGVGQLVPSVEFAQTLKLVDRSTGQPATELQIADEYHRVMAQPAGKVASSYKSATQLELPEPAIEQLLDQRIDEFSNGLTQKVKEFPNMPEPAKEALLDMAFNLGVSGLTTKFPKLLNAAKQQDWSTCAAECSRRGIGDQRNQATRDLFLNANTG